MQLALKEIVRGIRAVESAKPRCKLADVADENLPNVRRHAVPVGHNSSELSHGAMAGFGRAEYDGEIGSQAQSVQIRTHVSRTDFACISFLFGMGSDPRRGADYCPISPRVPIARGSTCTIHICVFGYLLFLVIHSSFICTIFDPFFSHFCLQCSCAN